MAKRKKKHTWKKGSFEYRKYPLPAWFNTTPYGVCRWCNKAICNENGEINLKRRWHNECVHAYFMVTRSNYAKRFVKKRDKGICAKCGLKCRLRHEWNVDHIKPLAEAKGDISYWHIDNLQTLCVSCHKIKSTSERIAGRKAKRNKKC